MIIFLRGFGVSNRRNMFDTCFCGHLQWSLGFRLKFGLFGCVRGFNFGVGFGFIDFFIDVLCTKCMIFFLSVPSINTLYFFVFVFPICSSSKTWLLIKKKMLKKHSYVCIRIPCVKACNQASYNRLIEFKCMLIVEIIWAVPTNLETRFYR